MNYNDILEFVKQNPICNLATCEGTQAHTRAFVTNIIDGRFYFTTSALKSVGKQIMSNPKSELCYQNSDFSRMLRITTTIKITDDKKIKQYLIDNREYLKDMDINDPDFMLFTIENSTAHFWSIENNLKEDDIEKIHF